jgi:glycosyltransferase involved in cell wall biosynthesis
MRIAVDAEAIFRHPYSGIAKTTRLLYRTIAELFPAWRVLMIHETAGSSNPFEGVGNVSCRRVQARGHRFAGSLNLWRDVYLPGAAAAWRAQLLHCPANTAPRWSWVPFVLTLHDLTPLEVYADEPHAIRWGQEVARSVARARHILTGSFHVRGLITERFGVKPECVTAVHHGPTATRTGPSDGAALDSLKRRHGVAPEKGFVLVFGSSHPYKNTRRSIDAWAALPESLRDRFALMVIGLDSATQTDLASWLGARCRAGDVALCGPVPDPQIGELLAGAALLCYPSEVEGFGLPIVEAFTCGTPVLTSAASSMPEVAGGAALLVDPLSTDSIRDGLAAALGSEALRDDLRERGRRRLQDFSWPRSAVQVADVLRRAV